jgi:hypothetical protein
MSIPGIKTLLQGDSGTGKTYSLGSLVEYSPSLHVHYFAFESGVETLIGFFKDAPPRGRGLKELPKNLHITTIKAASASWSDLADNVRMINTLSYGALKKVTDTNRSKYDQFEKFLRTFNDVVSDDGEKFGPIDQWGPNRAVVIDGLTGLGRAAMQAVVGGKIDRDQPDYGLAMGLIEEFLRRATDASSQFHFIVQAHIERETDIVNGGSRITISTLGNKLWPKIPPMFSDVVLTKRLGREFFWDTEDPQAVTKTRYLPIASKIPPNFKQILDAWIQRGGVI